MQITVTDWLHTTERKLEEAGIATARLDSLILLEDVLGYERAYLLAHDDYVITGKQLELLNILLERRAKHEPIAYIRGKSAFYGRDFLVSKDTLQPRPESETIVELLGKLPEVNNASYLVDVGTGSGALAISAALNHPELKVSATELSDAALKIAKKNAKKHNATVSFYHGDLLQPIKYCPDIIVANLPYVPDNHTINEAAMQEPKMAIFGGADGLDLYRKMFEQITSKNWKIKVILTESLPPQHELLADIASSHRYHQVTVSDFIQVFRPTS